MIRKYYNEKYRILFFITLYTIKNNFTVQFCWLKDKYFCETCRPTYWVERSNVKFYSMWKCDVKYKIFKYFIDTNAKEIRMNY